ncbi:VanZ family protein [Clostridium intestinale]|uniref:Glycopeptide antibiotics resistance protein n=1 Tax=Clostridium intestinale DSM 6191 TaxID=1121320 RepID=A0A1M5YL46_9CLOT|nr:VanZ family protein [Clostridium intestinale]SHI12722.1 Glycopeptide antibiotics resistance protein [Clostridium intestinale DSM 6191]
MKNGKEKAPKGNEVLADSSEGMKDKLRIYVFIGTIVYTTLILYFMFFGFNRIGARSEYNQYTFIIVPEGISLRFPELTMSWLYDFGNMAAFIPFGIVVPLLYRVCFRRFIVLFISAILFLEVVQSLTFMGTFDIMDVISNTLGAMIGFVGYRVGFSYKFKFKKLVASVASMLVLIVGVMVVSETIDYCVNVNKRIGPIEALNEVNTSTPITEDFSPFTVQGEEVQPEINLFSSEDGMGKEYSFNLGKKNLWFYAKCGIPDNEVYKGSVKIVINGEEWIQFNDEDEDKDILKVKSFFDVEIEDVKIIVTGNAKVWDVSIAEIKHWWE